MTMFGGLDVPGCLLDHAHASGLLTAYLERGETGPLYSGAAFDTYPARVSRTRSPTAIWCR